MKPLLFLWAGGGGAVYGIYLLEGVVEVFVRPGQVGDRSPNCVLLPALLASTDVNILPGGSVGAVLRPISRYSRRS